MSDKISLQLSDWLYNSGVVGLVNILEHADEEVEYKGQEVIFDIKALEGFEEKYFKYFIDIYEKTLSWHKIVSFESFIEKHENEEFRNFDKKSLEILNNFIGSGSKSGSLKYLLVSASYKSAYKLINSEVKILQIEKEIKAIKLKKGQETNCVIEEIKKTLGNIKKIINYLDTKEGKKFIAGKNVIYSIIKNAWEGVCFLNSQTKIPNMYEDYNEYFVKKVFGYNETDSKKFNYNCITCDRSIKDLNNDLSFLKATGFDTSRKPSHVWNFVNDIAICPICKLTYSCVPAGFTYINRKGLFVNQNNSINTLVRINKKIRYEILEDAEKDNIKSIYNVYRNISESFEQKSVDNTKFELADIQIVRYEDENYRFNLLSKNTLRVLYKSKEELKSLMKTGFKDINTYFNLFDEVIKRIINNENLFLLIHKVMMHKLSRPKEAYYHFGHIMNMLKINIIFLEGVANMEKKGEGILNLAKNSGYYLKKAYVEKNSESKLNGIAYRLLNALKTNNKHMFMDTLINSYMYIKGSVPKVFVEAMKDVDEFKSVGYAFVAGITGIIEEKSNTENGGM